jgi:hypothetical protein
VRKELSCRERRKRRGQDRSSARNNLG